jgi:hypothetical protein
LNGGFIGPDYRFSSIFLRYLDALTASDQAFGIGPLRRGRPIWRQPATD